MLFGILPEEIFSCLFSCCHIYRHDARLRVGGTNPDMSDSPYDCRGSFFIPTYGAELGGGFSSRGMVRRTLRTDSAFFNHSLFLFPSILKKYTIIKQLVNKFK